MATASIDHIAMPTANAERLIAFYKRLGFTINDEEEWRDGKANIFSIQIGDSKINVHPEGYVAGLRGPSAVPRLRGHLLRVGWDGRGVPGMAGRRWCRGDSRTRAAQGRTGLRAGRPP